MFIQFVCLCLVGVVVLSAPANEKKGNVYLIDRLDTGAGDGTKLPDKYLAKHESDGIKLSDPIPYDENLPDGVYFKPVDGKTLEPNTKLKTSPKV